MGSAKEVGEHFNYEEIIHWIALNTYKGHIEDVMIKHMKKKKGRLS